MVTDRARAHTAPRTAIVWTVLRGEIDRRAREGTGALRVLDAGGGSGVFAVPLAELGHRVTVVDTSADALATLERRAGDAGVVGLIEGIQGDVDRLTDVVPGAAFDLVLCHGLLEVVDDATEAVRMLREVVGPGGRLSVLTANTVATVLARTMNGHPDEALRAFSSPAGRWGDADGVRRRFDTAALVALLADAGLRTELLHGAGVVADLVPGAVLDATVGVTDMLGDLELAVAAVPPYRDIATHIHALASVDGHASPTNGTVGRPG